MEILSTLFGSEAKVKTMRLFLFNREAAFDQDDIAYRTGEKVSEVKKVLPSLVKIGLVNRKAFSKVVEVKKGKKVVSKKKKVRGFTLNAGFKYLPALHNLLINVSPLEPKELMRRIGKTGKLKFIVATGIFTQDDDARLDLLVVGDELRGKTLEKAVRSIETEIGKEIRYSAFSTPDFKYRLSMYDKLIRDVLDFPHQILVDKLGISSK